MTHEQIANDLLTPLWRGIAPEYKKKYRIDIWEQFTNRIRSASYTTARLPVFLETITTRLGISLHATDLEKVMAIIQSLEAPTILTLLRNDTVLLVALVRLANEERKEQWEKKTKQKKERSSDANADL